MVRISNQLFDNIKQPTNHNFKFLLYYNTMTTFDLNKFKKITKEIYFVKTKEKSFKKYLKSKDIDGDFIWGLPWIFTKDYLFEWDYRNYECFKYKSNNSIIMNYFTE